MYNKERCETSWYSFNVSGSGGKTGTSVQTTKNGWILTGDFSNGAVVRAHDLDDQAVVRFASEYASVFVCEIDPKTIAVYVDEDNDGEYGSEIARTVAPMEGDINYDGNVSIADAVMFARYCTEDPDIPKYLVGPQDLDEDGFITVGDITSILKKLSSLL